MPTKPLFATVSPSRTMAIASSAEMILSCIVPPALLLLPRI